MVLLQLLIINRSGGVIFNKNLSSAAPMLTVNDFLRLGSTFHGLHAIATQVAPTESSGIHKLETDTFILQCFQSLTGVKFVVTATPGTSEVDSFLSTVYELYSDFVLKNPFYEMEMPIRCELFVRNFDKLLSKFGTTPKRRT